MPISSWDKSQIRVGIDPATGNYCNHNDPSSLPKVVSEEVYKRIVASTPHLKWTLEGEKMVHNDTKTVRDAFSIIPGDKEIEAQLNNKEVDEPEEAISHHLGSFPEVPKGTLSGTPIRFTKVEPINGNNMNNIDEAVLVFTRTVVDLHRAAGAKEKLSRKSYANGFARCLLILYPDMTDKIKRIASDGDSSEDNILF